MLYGTGISLNRIYGKSIPTSSSYPSKYSNKSIEETSLVIIPLGTNDLFYVKAKLPRKLKKKAKKAKNPERNRSLLRSAGFFFSVFSPQFQIPKINHTHHHR
jgi:hypothetical protein